jgi:hypothetical protein
MTKIIDNREKSMKHFSTLKPGSAFIVNTYTLKNALCVKAQNPVHDCNRQYYDDDNSVNAMVLSDCSLVYLQDDQMVTPVEITVSIEK